MFLVVFLLGFRIRSGNSGSARRRIFDVLGYGGIANQMVRNVRESIASTLDDVRAVHLLESRAEVESSHVKPPKEGGANRPPA